MQAYSCWCAKICMCTALWLASQQDGWSSCLCHLVLGTSHGFWATTWNVSSPTCSLLLTELKTIWVISIDSRHSTTAVSGFVSKISLTSSLDVTNCHVSPVKMTLFLSCSLNSELSSFSIFVLLAPFLWLTIHEFASQTLGYLWYYVTKQRPLLSDSYIQPCNCARIIPLRDSESTKALLALGRPCPTGVCYNL